MVFSASPTMGLKVGDTYFFIKRHLFYLLLGLCGLYFALRCDLELLRKWAFAIYAFSMILLLLLFVPGVGRQVLGATRWINLGLISFQPSELIKFSMIVILARLLSDLGEGIVDFLHGLLPILVLIGLTAIIVILQPDLGTAIAIVLISVILLFVAGIRLAHLGFLLGSGLLAVIALSLTSPYRLRRLTAFLDPWKDPQGSGFQIIQSLLAVGSGGWHGLGLGASRQKYFYLPQQFTDFIFAILGEELGFIGGVVVIILFIIFIVRGLKIALSQHNHFCSLLATGIVSWLALQTLMNIMVVIGLLPTTGIPLPFISYGGTSTIVNLFAVGILINISLWPGKESKAKAK